jgi:cobalt transporter subunit CbtB
MSHLTDLQEITKGSTLTESEKHSLSIPKRTPLLITALLGVVMLFAVGFAPLNIVHNAAHDARHVHAFPCH